MSESFYLSVNQLECRFRLRVEFQLSVLFFWKSLTCFHCQAEQQRCEVGSVERVLLDGLPFCSFRLLCSLEFRCLSAPSGEYLQSVVCGSCFYYEVFVGWSFRPICILVFRWIVMRHWLFGSFCSEVLFIVVAMLAILVSGAVGDAVLCSSSWNRCHCFSHLYFFRALSDEICHLNFLCSSSGQDVVNWLLILCCCWPVLMSLVSVAVGHFCFLLLVCCYQFQPVAEGYQIWLVDTPVDDALAWYQVVSRFYRFSGWWFYRVYVRSKSSEGLTKNCGRKMELSYFRNSSCVDESVCSISLITIYGTWLFLHRFPWHPPFTFFITSFSIHNKRYCDSRIS